MADVLSGLPVGQISAGALVALIALLILTGRLVPRQQIVDKQADCDKWREAAEKWQLVATESGMTLEKILAGVELTTHAIVDIRELAIRTEREREQ